MATKKSERPAPAPPSTPEARIQWSGRYVFNGGAHDNMLAVLRRHPTSGRLTFVEVERDDQDGGNADGLFACRDVEVSADGRHVYTAALADNKIGLFQRNPSTGALTFVSVVADDVGGVTGLGGVRDVTISHDGRHLYSAAYADDALNTFSRDATTGALTFENSKFDGVGGVSGLDSLDAVKVSPDGKHVYTVAGKSLPNLTQGSDALSVFRRDTDPISPTFGELEYIESYFDGVAGVDGLFQVTDLEISPDGKHVYTVAEADPAGGGTGHDDWIAVFARDATTGKLTWLRRIAGFKICPTATLGGEAENYLEMDANGLRLYASKNWKDSGVAAFTRNPATGLLTFREGLCEGDPHPIGLGGPRKLSLEPLGADLYVAGNASNAISVLSVCTATFFVRDLTNGGSEAKTVVHAACDKIRAGGTPIGYTVLEAGKVTFRAPVIELASGFEVRGAFTAETVVP